MQHFVMLGMRMLSNESAGGNSLGPEAKPVLHLDEMGRNEHVDMPIRRDRLPVTLSLTGSYYENGAAICAER
jgi:hypothetical protein